LEKQRGRTTGNNELQKQRQWLRVRPFMVGILELEDEKSKFLIMENRAEEEGED